MKSLITYFGGKGTMHSKIIENFPQSFNMYIEPFGGAYSIGFQATELLKNKVEFYNDLDSNVYSIFKVLSDKTLFEDFKNILDITPYSEELRQEFKMDLKKDISISERAFKYFYVNRCSYQGMGGFAHCVLNRRGMAKTVSSYLATIDGLYEYNNRISKVCVTNRDGIGLIETYNTKDVFLYCDPPYVQSTRTECRYAVDMNDEIQKRFLNACLNSEAKILISGYDNPLYDILETKFTKSSFAVDTVSGNRVKKTKIETLWKNY